MAQTFNIARDLRASQPVGPVQSGVLPFGIPPVQDWLALSGAGFVDVWANPFQTMDRGCFVAELHMPLPMGKVLINMRSTAAGERGFALFAAPDGGLSILHRIGPAVLRIGVPLGPVGSAYTLRLTYRFNAQTRQWMVRLQPLDGEAPAQEVTGVGALPFAHKDIEDICKSADCDASVLWYGFSRNDSLPENAPWIGPNTPIETTRGTVLAGNLAVGDMVLTQDRGPIPLRGLQKLALPARGSFAPVLLRGPIYSKHCDVLVSASQRIVVSGGEVEYLFGTESVLVEARNVVDGHTALADGRHDVIAAVVLDLGGAALVGGAGWQNDLTLALGDITQTDTAPLPCLNSFETVALMRMMGRVVSKAT